jgi:lactoylglutathione lyase
MEKVNLGLAHIGIFVKDLEVSKKFYCEKLDFTIIHETSIEENGGLTKIAFVKAVDCTLELVQLQNYAKRPDGPVDHVAFKVKDIEKAAETLKARGIEFETKDIAFAPHFFEKGDKWILFRGPDGEHLEINEIL